MVLREKERFLRTFYALHCPSGGDPRDGPTRHPGGSSMSRRLRLATILAASVGLASAFAPPAGAQGGVNVGNLTCNVSSGWGLVFRSSRALHCPFAGAAGRYEYYPGNVMK